MAPPLIAAAKIQDMRRMEGIERSFVSMAVLGFLLLVASLALAILFSRSPCASPAAACVVMKLNPR